jgi:acyl carrier protein
MTIEQRLRHFIIENFYVSDAAALANDTSLIDGGYVDSTGMLEVIAFLESEFSIQVAEEELVPGNFETIDRIAAYVTRKQQAAVG